MNYRILKRSVSTSWLFGCEHTTSNQMIDLIFQLNKMTHWNDNSLLGFSRKNDIFMWLIFPLQRNNRNFSTFTLVYLPLWYACWRSVGHKKVVEFQPGSKYGMANDIFEYSLSFLSSMFSEHFLEMSCSKPYEMKPAHKRLQYIEVWRISYLFNSDETHYKPVIWVCAYYNKLLSGSRAIRETHLPIWRMLQSDRLK